MTTDRQIAHRIRERRIELGITQHQLAEMMGVNWTAISIMEKGNRHISNRTTAQIAEALDVESAYFLEGTKTNA